MIIPVKADINDIAFLVNLSKAEYLKETLLEVPTDEGETETFWVNYLSKNNIYLAKFNNIPLGFMAYQEEVTKVVLDCVIVDKQYAGEGVGSDLIRSFMDKFLYAQPKLVYGWVSVNNKFLVSSLIRQGWIVSLNEKENLYGEKFNKIVFK